MVLKKKTKPVKAKKPPPSRKKTAAKKPLKAQVRKAKRPKADRDSVAGSGTPVAVRPTTPPDVFRLLVS